VKQASPQTVLIGLLMFWALVSSRAIACTYFPPSYKIGKNFTIKVSSLERMTFAGIRVILVRGNRVSRFALTDDGGTARFENVEPGDYSLEIDQLGTAGWDTAGLQVIDGLDKQSVQLHWPSSRILQATEMKGTFLDSRTAKPIAETSLRLVHGLNGSQEGRVVTDQAGRFDFSSPEPGLYFIRVDSLRPGEWEPRGSIPVLVKPESMRDLFLALGESSCGMMYSEVCVASPTTVSHLDGKLSDKQGAAIDRANIDLVQKSNDQRTMKSVAPDKAGHFAIPDVPPGDYQWRARSVGFAPLLVPLTVVPKASTDTSIDVQMSILGSSCAEGRTHQPEDRAN
jgi:hypothetical protein